MTHEDQIQRIASAISALPPEKREFVIGYAEGVIAARASALPASTT